MVFVDYKKAFDMVDHATLLSKLEAYNLDKNALLWCKSYLTDHTQLVSFIGQLSSFGTLTAGVPQGSMLGPLLFVVLSVIYPTLTCPFSGSVAKCCGSWVVGSGRGSWVVGSGRGSWVWVWVNVVGKKEKSSKKNKN